MGKLIEDHFERQARKEEVLECMRNDDWKGVLDHFSRPGDNYHDPMLVWIRPSLEAIQFIESELKRSISYLKKMIIIPYFMLMINRISPQTLNN